MLEERIIKVKETVDEVYNCLISKNNYEHLTDYLEYLLYCKEEGKSEYKGLCVVDNRKGECSYFVEKLFECLNKLEIISEYRLAETKGSIEIYLAGSFSVVCGEWKELKPYKELNKGVNFNDLYPYQIVYETPDKDEFIQSFYRYSENINKECSFDEGFDKEIREYVAVVYSRSHRRNYDFVADLYKRVVNAAQKRKNYTDSFTALDIPYYNKPLSAKECVSEAKKSLLFSKDISKFFDRFVNENRQINDRIGYNVFVKADDTGDIDKFAKCYASLLYSKDYRLTNVSDVLYDFDVNEDIDNIEKVLSAKDSISSLVRVRNVKDELSEELLKLIAEYDEYYWIIEVNEELNEAGFSFIDLDKNDRESLKAYLNNYLYGRIIKNKGNDRLLEKEYPNRKVFDKAIAEAIELNGTDDGNTVDALYERLVKDDDEVKGIVEKAMSNGNRQRNVLIMASSSFGLLPYDITAYKYEDIEGYYLTQLEPACKVLAKKLGRSNEHLTDIIIFDTDNTSGDTEEGNKRLISVITGRESSDTVLYSSTDYLKYRLSYLGLNENNIRTIKIAGAIESSMSKLLECLNEIASKDIEVKVYLDIHGGLRENQVILDAVVSLLKISDIELADVLYAEHNRGKKLCSVRSVKKSFGIYDFVSGVNEFLSFGRSKSLEAFDSASGMNNKEFVSKIKDVSNSIQLCQMDNFMKELKKLNEVVSKSNNNTYIGMFNSELRKSYDVRMFGKDYNLIDLAKQGKNNYINFACQLKWCMEKDFIQQALTLIESKTATVLEDEGIFVNRKMDLLQKDIYHQILDSNKELRDAGFKADTQSFNKYSSIVKYAFSNDRFNTYSISEQFNSWLNTNVLNQKGEKNTRKYYNNNKLAFKDINISNLRESIELIVSEDNDCSELISFMIKETNRLVNPNLDDYFRKYLYNFRFSLFIKDKGKPIKLNFEDMLACANDKICNNDSLMDFFYVFLYVCKNLKLLRNDANHALGESGVDIETLKAWMKIYLILMREVIKKGS